MIAGTQFSAPANASEPEFAPVALPTKSVPMTPDPLPPVDPEAVAEAAQDFESGNAADAAALAAAAVSEEAVPIERTPGGMIAETETGTVMVDKTGEATISAEGMPEIGISVKGDPDAVRIVDGSVVQTEVAASTDIVTRATENGVQMIAILGDEGAPDEIQFPLDLPEGARLVAHTDGSIAIIAQVAARRAQPGEFERALRDVESAVGPLREDTLLTDEEWALVERIDPIRTVPTVEEIELANLAAPWAVDAEGQRLRTHYEITTHGITQIIETDQETVYPVTADPTIEKVTLSGFQFHLSKDEVKKYAGYSSYAAIGTALCKAIPGVAGVVCALYAAYVAGNTIYTLNKAKSEKKCARFLFGWQLFPLAAVYYKWGERYKC